MSACVKNRPSDRLTAAAASLQAAAGPRGHCKQATVRPVRNAIVSIMAIVAMSAGGAGPAPTAAQPATTAPSVTDESSFLAENNAAMDKMMAGMNVKPTGDVDADFVAMMIPHHQGAIDMALAELRYGKNEQLRRIAQEIIVDQQQEIAAMRLAVGQPLPPSAPAPTEPGRGLAGPH
jgi:hypothetical protein